MQITDTLDCDEWLHTGDVGESLSNGAIKIVDRKKNIFKLKNGTSIVPDKLERIYGGESFIKQILIYGDSL